uniref:Uncharacterized protein LOC100177666 n=1 Tax=Phallusia mammillata TaxID=59560 RepID=A0A6F9DGY0_9ASCI|nr:uncharacterized protein LOC100177666 [Phallusia mammillata]
MAPSSRNVCLKSMMNSRVFGVAFVFLVLFSFLPTSVDAAAVRPRYAAVHRREAFRESHCGENAVKFMRWFCKDDSFRFPFPFNRPHLIRKQNTFPSRVTHPFHHQYVRCCKHDCDTPEYTWMCDVHRSLKKCRKTPKSPKRAMCERDVLRANPLPYSK